jgi:hypothetical protein
MPSVISLENTGGGSEEQAVFPIMEVDIIEAARDVRLYLLPGFPPVVCQQQKTAITYDPSVFLVGEEDAVQVAAHFFCTTPSLILMDHSPLREGCLRERDKKGEADECESIFGHQDSSRAGLGSEVEERVTSISGSCTAREQE